MLVEFNNKTVEITTVKRVKQNSFHQQHDIADNKIPAHWINHYLEIRSLTSVNSSRPLYAYQTSLAEVLST